MGFVGFLQSSIRCNDVSSRWCFTPTRLRFHERHQQLESLLAGERGEVDVIFRQKVERVVSWEDQYASFGVLGHQSSRAWTSSTKIVRDLLGHTFYAHNGGSYDAMFLFKEGLLEDDRFDIPEPPVDQDGKYIHFNVIVGGDTVITFRDSLGLRGW